VINISSVASTRATPNSVVYSATKGALEAITRGLAMELGLGRSGSTPSRPAAWRPKGYTRPESWAATFQKQMVSETPLGRFGQPEDVARVAVFLASEESGWITGERIAASGGWRIGTHRAQRKRSNLPDDSLGAKCDVDRPVT